MSERRQFASLEFVETELENDWVVAYPTDPPGSLSFCPGLIRAYYRLDFAQRPAPAADDHYANVACFFHVPDAAGTLWEARTCFSPHLFLDRLLDLDARSDPAWEYRDRERAAALAGHPLITGLEMVEDGRYYRHFWIDDVLLEIKFKYQGLTIDVGYLDPYQVAVRVSGFFGTWNHAPLDVEGYLPPWRGGAVRPPLEDFDAESQGLMEFPPDETPGCDCENLAPILYTLSARELFFNDTAGFRDDGFYASGIPKPIVFRSVEGKAVPPQTEVTFRADT